MAEASGDFVGLGEVIGGYRLERVLGAGSTSQVFLGQHVVLGRRAAIKVLSHKLIGNEDVITRLLNEARAVNDIRHPNLIDISDFINTESPRRVALVMEYIEGPSLTICREHPLTFEQAIGVMIQLVRAVRAAHSAGVIHRDLKPDNLLLTSDPRKDPGTVPSLKIVDFGIAKIAHSNLAQTAVGTMLGTPAYMAPEQIAGRPRPSAATDVFAIGEVLYEVLTSRRAYPAGTISDTVRAKLRGELPKLELPAMPGDKALLQIITKSLAYRPEDRPGLQEVLSILEGIMPGGSRVDAKKELEDVDASEIDTRMVQHEKAPPSAAARPVLPPPATTEVSMPEIGVDTDLSLDPAELTPLSTPIPPRPPTRAERPPSDEDDPHPTEASPIPPRIRRLAGDMTSPTNRVLPALTELDPIADLALGVPNAPTLPGILNRKDLQNYVAGAGTAKVVRDEQSMVIRSLGVGDSRHDDEASMQVDHLRLGGAAMQAAFDDDPLRIQPTPKTPTSGDRRANDDLSEVSISGDAPSVDHPAYDLPALGLSQPAGITDSNELDAGDLGDDAPQEEAPAPAPEEPAPDSLPPYMPDTRITRVRSSAKTSNRGILILAFALAGTAGVVVYRRTDVAPPPKALHVDPPPPPAPPPPPRGVPRNQVVIESDPPGADVLYLSEDRDVEPLKLGVTPLQFQLPDLAGRQKLRIAHPSYPAVDVVVTPENPRIHVSLQR